MIIITIYFIYLIFLRISLSFLRDRRLHFPSCTSQGGEGFLVKMAAPLTLLLILAVTIRAALYRSSLADLIAERVEVVSPLTAWKRGKRGFSRFFWGWRGSFVAQTPLRLLPHPGAVTR